jgi:cytochrome b involved in lipid metabolism
MPTPVEQVSANINQYDMAEISKHATAADCWMSIEGKVYNVTSFVNSHPGGEKILKGCGTDATMLFNKIRSHAKGSVQALKSKFEIGTLIVK